MTDDPYTIEPGDVVVALARQRADHAEVIVMKTGADVASFEPGECADLCGMPYVDPRWETWSEGDVRLIKIPLAEYNVFPHTA